MTLYDTIDIGNSAFIWQLWQKEVRNHNTLCGCGEVGWTKVALRLNVRMVAERRMVENIAVKHGVDIEPNQVRKIKNSMRENLCAKLLQECLLPSVEGRNLNEIEFLKKLQAVAADNLADTTFGAKDFANSMHMSRMQLHRKLKALTGTSFTMFMRQHRLHAAARLLIGSDLSVAQTAYNVGFASPSYFSKCFREKYNMTPMQYVKVMKG